MSGGHCSALPLHARYGGGLIWTQRGREFRRQLRYDFRTPYLVESPPVVATLPRAAKIGRTDHRHSVTPR